MARQTTETLFNACLMDYHQVSSAALVDFGLDGWRGTDPDEIFTAYSKAIRAGKLTIDQLDSALGNGKKLSELIGTTVRTVWDHMEEE